MTTDDSFDPLEYLTYLRRSGKFAAVAVVSAMAVTAIVSLLLPKQYTATATLVIEPPVANDPRAATAVTPIYLESLKTYEQFAASDTLFAKACTKFALAETPGAPCTESFKRRVLRVTKLRDTKVLQIGVTLPDAQRAQKLVEFLAMETVALNRSLAKDGDREVLAEVREQLSAAKEEARTARAKFDTAVSTGAAELLDEEVRTLSDLKSRTEVEILRSKAALAELSSTSDATGRSAEQARLKSLDTEASSFSRQLATQATALAVAQSRRDSAKESLRIAEAKYDAWTRRANDAAVTSGTRTEQLRVVDPGVVPQQPSFPNPTLFTLAAGLISALLTLAFLSLRFGLRRQRVQQQLRKELSELDREYKAARGGQR
jgi:uncharacterized protein involved in exopolysaccharide biosynthesis